MSIKAFINFVELPTKIASEVPFLVGSIYSNTIWNNTNY